MPQETISDDKPGKSSQQNPSDVKTVAFVGDIPGEEKVSEWFGENASVESFYFRSAREAEDFFDFDHVGLVVTGLVLSDMDGRTFLRRIRRNPRTAACPVLVLAAQAGSYLLSQLRSLGATEIASSPLQDEDLQRRVLELLDQQEKPESQEEEGDGSGPGLLDRNAFVSELEDAITALRGREQPTWFGIFRAQTLKDSTAECGQGVRDGIFRKSARLIRSGVNGEIRLSNWSEDEIAFLASTEGSNHLKMRVERLVRTLSAQPYEVDGDQPFQVTFVCATIRLGADDRIPEAVLRLDRLLAIRSNISTPCLMWGDQNFEPPRRRLLLALPDELVPDMIRSSLERDGFEVVQETSLSGAAALLSFSEPFEMIVVDTELAAKDSFCAVHALQKASVDNPPPILAVVGAGESSSLESALASGAQEYLVKPFSATDLLRRLYSLFKIQDKIMEEVEQVYRLPSGTVVDALARAVRSGLLAGEHVEVPGLGYFEVAYVESALEQDADGQHFLRPPRNTVSFSPEKES